MKHRVKNIQFHSGKDSDKMIMRKLLMNFLLNAHIETTETKAKALRATLDRVVAKTREETESNKNYLLRYFPDARMIRVLFGQVGPAVKDIAGGYVRIVRLNQRENDGALMARVEWAHPVVIDWNKNKSNKKEQKSVQKESETDAKTKSQSKSKK